MMGNLFSGIGRRDPLPQSQTATPHTRTNKEKVLSWIKRNDVERNATATATATAPDFVNENKNLDPLRSSEMKTFEIGLEGLEMIYTGRVKDVDGGNKAPQLKRMLDLEKLFAEHLKKDEYFRAVNNGRPGESLLNHCRAGHGANYVFIEAPKDSDSNPGHTTVVVPITGLTSGDIASDNTLARAMFNKGTTQEQIKDIKRTLKSGVDREPSESERFGTALGEFAAKMQAHGYRKGTLQFELVSHSYGANHAAHARRTSISMRQPLIVGYANNQPLRKATDSEFDDWRRLGLDPRQFNYMFVSPKDLVTTVPNSAVVKKFIDKEIGDKRDMNSFATIYEWSDPNLNRFQQHNQPRRNLMAAANQIDGLTGAPRGQALVLQKRSANELIKPFLGRHRAHDTLPVVQTLDVDTSTSGENHKVESKDLPDPAVSVPTAVFENSSESINISSTAKHPMPSRFSPLNFQNRNFEMNASTNAHEQNNEAMNKIFMAFGYIREPEDISKNAHAIQPSSVRGDASNEISAPSRQATADLQMLANHELNPDSNALRSSQHVSMQTLPVEMPGFSQVSSPSVSVMAEATIGNPQSTGSSVQSYAGSDQQGSEPNSVSVSEISNVSTEFNSSLLLLNPSMPQQQLHSMSAQESPQPNSINPIVPSEKFSLTNPSLGALPASAEVNGLVSRSTVPVGAGELQIAGTNQPVDTTDQSTWL